MAIQKINLGTKPHGVGGDSYRTANEKINSNFEEVEKDIEDVSNSNLETFDKLSEEVLRAKSAESDLNTNIIKEVSNRESEVARLDGVDAVLQSQINSVGGGKLAYKTYAEMVADKSNIPEKSSIDVLADTGDKNGMYLFDGTDFVKSNYDLEKLIRAKVQNTFSTYDQMVASDLNDGSYALVVEDTTSNNGLYLKEEGVWVMSIYSLSGPPVMKPKMVTGTYISSEDGSLISNLAHRLSDYIRINPDSEYLITVHTTEATACAFYDANKLLINVFGSDNDGVEFAILPPPNAYYMRLTTHVTGNAEVKSSVVTKIQAEELIQQHIDRIKERYYPPETFYIHGQYMTTQGEMRNSTITYANWYTTPYLPVYEGDTVVVRTVINSTEDRPAATLYDKKRNAKEIFIVPANYDGMFEVTFEVSEDGLVKAQHASGGGGISTVTVNGGLSKLVNTDRLVEIISRRQDEIEASQGMQKEVTSGAYSWWNEPQSCQIDGIFPKTTVGAVDMDWHKLVTMTATDKKVNSDVAYLAHKTQLQPDAHNAAVSRPVGGKLIVFQVSHNNWNYLQYRVSNSLDPKGLGDVKKIMSPNGVTSYVQVLHSSHTGKLYVLFRSNGVRSWYLSESDNWDADEPIWNTKAIFSDDVQMYVRAVMSHDGKRIHCITTKNARYEDINGLWYAYIDLESNELRKTNDELVTTLGTSTAMVEQLSSIYPVTSGRIRLYDASTNENKLPILLQTMEGVEVDGGPYRYVELNLQTWEIDKDVAIVESGKSLGTNWYYGGAHFSNILGGDNTVPDSVGPVFTARESDGTWFVEEWDTQDEGETWDFVRVVDSSRLHKLWRPRVPFNTRLTNKPCVKLTWCRGSWRSYTNYQAQLIASIE